jgi:redox-sensing transcriptional repressor
MRYHRIPDETVQRLPISLRGTLQLSQDGVDSISSDRFANHLGIHSWQIRKDLSYIDNFGIPGVGNDLKNLSKQIKRILKLNTQRLVAFVGVGNLGCALLTYPGFIAYGLKIDAAFDYDETKVGTIRNGITIQDIANLPDLITSDNALGIVTVPEEAAQDVADRLVTNGIKGIVNLSSRALVIPPKVKIIFIDIVMDLARLPC